MDIVPDSKLPNNEERFLSKFITMLISLGYITVETLYSVFPPLELFTRYENEPERRRALFGLTKLGAEYTNEFDLASSANILAKGVKLGDVKLSDLYHVVSPDELVRVHDRQMLFLLTKDAKPFAHKDEKSQSLMMHAINDVIKERLGSNYPADIEKDREDGKASKVYQFVIDAIGESVFMSDAVPAEARGRILKAGLDAYKEGHLFTPDFIFHAVPLAEFVRYLPFEQLEPVIDAVALKFGWVNLPKSYEVPKPETSSVIPPAMPQEQDAPEIDDPEVSVSGDFESDEPTVVVTSGQYTGLSGKRGHKKADPSTPPPLPGKR